ncbi:hypothetical protein AAF712_006446 [Marasmius tenuissimus]|uniref:Protein kinase domain-containing protein n=1 Tax=Marasmius tenuissimus TaxID=585030 RepID=A0ABR2ZZC1_9AGAR
MTQATGTPPPLHFTNSFSGGKNNNNFYTGTQNINEGRDMNMNTGGGTMNINSYSSKDEDEEDEEEDKPFSEKMLKIELRAFNRQRSKLNETELKEIDGQDYLDKWQRMIISDLPGKIIPSADKLALLDAMFLLSQISGLAPKCLRIQDIGIQDLAPVPDIQFADVEFFKGKIGDLDVSVKAPKKQPRPDNKQLGLKGVATGLVYLHNQKVVHGDLSAFNILIDSAGIPYIGDLGLPQLLGKASDKSEDVYRFGRLAFELFGGTSLKGKDGPRRPLGVSNPMWEVVKKCLSTTPSSRPPASDIAEALSRYTNPITA